MARPQAAFCTVTDLRRRLGLPDKKGTATSADWLLADPQADPKIRAAIHNASRLVEGRCLRTFVPYVSERTYDAVGQQITSHSLRLDEDLLELSELVNGTGETIAGTDYVLDDLNSDVKWQVRLKRFTSSSFFYSGTSGIEGVISVSGTWGFHDDWANAFTDTLDTVQSNPLLIGDSLLTVSNTIGENLYGLLRFEVGMILRIGTELLLITAVNTTTQKLTVVRGYLGTTAAAHLQAVKIYSYQPVADIQDATAKLAIYFYQRNDTTGGEIQVLDSGYVLKDTTVEGILRQIEHRTRYEVGAVGGNP